MMRESFKWPARCTLTFTNKRGKVYFRSKDRELDLADSLMMYYPRNTRLVYMSVSTESSKWKQWTEENLKTLEDLVRYDITFDGYHLSMKRMTAVRSRAPFCTSPFQWQLQIRLALSRSKAAWLDPS